MSASMCVNRDGDTVAIATSTTNNVQGCKLMGWVYRLLVNILRIHILGALDFDCNLYIVS